MLDGDADVGRYQVKRFLKSFIYDIGFVYLVSTFLYSSGHESHSFGLFFFPAYDPDFFFNGCEVKLFYWSMRMARYMVQIFFFLSSVRRVLMVMSFFLFFVLMIVLVFVLYGQLYHIILLWHKETLLKPDSM